MNIPGDVGTWHQLVQGSPRNSTIKCWLMSKKRKETNASHQAMNSKKQKRKHPTKQAEPLRFFLCLMSPSTVGAQPPTLPAFREVIWRFIRQNEEPSNGAASRMDQRRLKKLYPLAGARMRGGGTQDAHAPRGMPRRAASGSARREGVGVDSFQWCEISA